MPGMKTMSIYLPKRWIKDLDKLVEKGYYANRSELIRVAIRDLLLREVWLPEKPIEHEIFRFLVDAVREAIKRERKRR